MTESTKKKMGTKNGDMLANLLRLVGMNKESRIALGVKKLMTTSIQLLKANKTARLTTILEYQRDLLLGKKR